MTWLKIIPLALTAIIAIGGFYSTKPSRPRLICFLSVLVGMVAITGIVSEIIDAKIKKQEQDKAVEKNTKLSTQIKNLNEQNKELIAGKDKLLELNTKLSREIGTYQQDLREKEEKIKELDKKAKMSARGITSIYDFVGNRRETTAGHIKFAIGPEAEIFKQMEELEKAKDFNSLIKLCKNQIEKTPDWLTPYLYLGVAQGNVGLKNEAIESFQYVVDNAPGDSEYKQAEEFLKRLKQPP